MDLRPTHADEKLLVEPYDPVSRDRKGADVSPDFRLFFNGVPMGLQPTHGDEKPPISHRRQPSRDWQGAVRYSAISKRFFKGVSSRPSKQQAERDSILAHDSNPQRVG
jgi:hypothetical protein